MKTLVLDSHGNKIGHILSADIANIKGIKSRGLNVVDGAVEPFIQLKGNGLFIITVYGIVG